MITHNAAMPTEAASAPTTVRSQLIAEREATITKATRDQRDRPRLPLIAERVRLTDDDFVRSRLVRRGRLGVTVASVTGRRTICVCPPARPPTRSTSSRCESGSHHATDLDMAMSERVRRSLTTMAVNWEAVRVRRCVLTWVR